MKTKYAVAGLVLAAAMIQQASAATMTSSFTNPKEITDISQSGTLALFDTNLGTLTGAVLTFTGAFDSTFTLTNHSTVSATATGRSYLDMDYTSTLAAVDTYLSSNPDLSLTFSTGSQSIVSGGSYSTSFTQAPTKTYDLSAILASLGTAGGGSFGLGCGSMISTSVGGSGGGITATQATQGMCGASITYTYMASPVPETGTLAMMSIGLLALAAPGLRRRMRR